MYLKILSAQQRPFCLALNSLWSADSIEYSNMDLGNIGSGNGLLPDGNKPLPDPMFTSNP